MLTLMCPNCRHRFPAPGCCNPAGSVMMQTSGGDEFSTSCNGSYCNGNEYLVPRGYLNSGGGCVNINSPTIIHCPTIIQNHNENEEHNCLPQNGFINSTRRWIEETGNKNQQLQIHRRNFPMTIDDSGTTNSGISHQHPHCKIGKTGEGSVTLAANNNNNKRSETIEGSINPQCGIFQNPHPMLYPAPSGCQELPGLMETKPTSNTTATTAFDFQINQDPDWTRTKHSNGQVFDDCNKFTPNLIHLSSSSGNLVPPNGSTIFSTSTSTSSSTSLINNSPININPTSSPTVIQLNATLQLPPNVAHCTVSITATANTIPSCNRARNNFNGGGIVEPDSFGNGGNICERDDNSPTTPVSWVLPFPWGVNGNTGNNSTDLERLTAAQRVLQISGWYHEGLSWQQSAALLKNSPVGSWLMRDSSDKRYMYAVSVQTARGPTAVRVHYVCGKFRLDAEPRMAPLMPMFDCPVKMIEHYIEYSKRMSEQKEVWVDHSGQLYSQIYLTKPLLKEVRSLSHLARLAINRNNISTQTLPNPLREYIADYPYTE